MTDKLIDIIVGIGFFLIFLALTVLAVEGWDKECDYREAQARKIVSYGVVK